MHRAPFFPPEADVDCGTIAVPENRDRSSRDKIRVAAAVIRSSSPNPKPDPIVFLQGGPSFGAISPFATEVYFGGAAYIEDRDLILVDTRGTGLSSPRLGCPEFDRAAESAFYSRPVIDTSYAEDFSKAVRRCHAKLVRRGIDLAAYDSAESAADLHDLRKALGYREWNLLAVSADGVLGRTYMRLYPNRIRSVIFGSPVSPEHLGNLDYMRGLTENLKRVFAGCAANAACRTAYPHIRAEFFDLVRRLEAHPRLVRIPDFRPRPVTIRVDGIGFYAGCAGAYARLN